ncbi:hypothetical protein ATCC90586_003019 [Pythium insidiosum]|nr:hypothetical protein ATCC90586_003019 [Pythium insidiosum]
MRATGWWRKTALAALATALALASGAYAADSNDTSPAAPTPTFLDFKSAKGALYADGKRFYIKGVNWFGFETIESVVQGLWPFGTTAGEAFDLLKNYDVNALRLPLALDSILKDQEVDRDQTAGTPSLAGKSYLEVLDYVIGEARARNILVLLVNHRMEAAEPDFPDVAEPKKIIPALKVLAERYCNNAAGWNVIGVDLKNEPKGTATWGTGDASTDWDLQAAEIGNAVLDKCKRWLIFVEGVQTNMAGVTVEWGQAGGSLHAAKKHPVKLKNMDRLVYSPHLIPPGVDYKSPWWLASNFPNNMPKIWDAAFGSVPGDTERAVVVGAWGSKMEGRDGKWANAVTAYLSENGIGSFYWAFNPQSADTGGLVKDDWKTPIEERFEMLSKLPSTKVSDLLKKYAACTDSCKGYGRCVEGQCECYAGWSGPQCEICTPGDAQACNNAGTCQKDSTCKCEFGVKGRYCSGESCEGIFCGSSKNAGCTNGVCVCSYGCVGNECTKCAANATALSAADELGMVLCDTCPAPDKVGGAAQVAACFGLYAALLSVWALL